MSTSVSYLDDGTLPSENQTDDADSRQKPGGDRELKDGRGVTDQSSVISQSAMIVYLLIVPVHVLLVGFNALTNSPTADEPAHFAAGAAMWKLGRFDLYQVNPPLVRLVATFPILASDLSFGGVALDESPGLRPEWEIGRALLRQNGSEAIFLLLLGRLLCLPFSILAIWILFRRAREWLGDPAGIAVAVLWAFSPLVVANASLITSDIAAASLGLFAADRWLSWARTPSPSNIASMGIAVGLAMAAKGTWVLLPGLLVLATIAYDVIRHRNIAIERRAMKTDALPAVTSATCISLAARLKDAVLAGVVALEILLLCYGGAGIFEPLGEQPFYSLQLAGTVEQRPPGPSLVGDDASRDWARSGNRFAGTLLGRVPLPVPSSYVRGLDIQKRDFEGGWRSYDSYAAGQLAKHGWWWFYPYCIAVKCPLPLLLLIGLTAVILLRTLARTITRTEERGLLEPRWALFIIPLAIGALIASQTGMSRCFRYLLPTWPYLLGLCGVTVSALAFRWERMAAVALLACLVLSTLAQGGQQLASFNFIAGGPVNGHRHLLDSNLDWGQDLFRLRRWIDAANLDQQQATTVWGQPIALAAAGTTPFELVGLPDRWAPPGELPEQTEDSPHSSGVMLTDYDSRLTQPPDMEPGVYVISANQLHGFDSGRSNYTYFRTFSPNDRIGASLFVYEVKE